MWKKKENEKLRQKNAYAMINAIINNNESISRQVYAKYIKRTISRSPFLSRLKNNNFLKRYICIISGRLSSLTLTYNSDLRTIILISDIIREGESAIATNIIVETVVTI